MYFLIHSSVVGHQDWNHNLGIVNSAAINMDVQSMSVNTESMGCPATDVEGS